jgi:HEAT repeat protein
MFFLKRNHVGTKDPRAIPVLQRLPRSSNSRARFGAVSALRQMRVMEAVEGLVITLADTNRDVRYQDVSGLAVHRAEPMGAGHRKFCEG